LVRRYTLEEFWELEAPPEGGYYELIAGVLYVVPPPTGPHNIAISNLNRVFSRYLDAHPGAGQLFVPRAAVWRPDWQTWLGPDLFLVTAERLRTTDAGRLDTADLVVEALSAGSATYDRTAKRTRTLPSGCASCGSSTSSGGRSSSASSRRAGGGSQARMPGPRRSRPRSSPA